jgi:L-iditol 2-dehydrogenase
MCRAFKASNIAPGGYAQIIALSGQHLAHTTFAIPPHISWREASCIEPLACVVRAVDKCTPPQGEATAAVIGLGFIGQLTGQVFGLRGYRTLGLDINPKRVALANVMQSVACATLPQDAALQMFLDATPTGGVDVVCLTVITSATLAQALTLVREGGTILIVAGPPTAEQGQLCADTLYHREVSVVTSYSPSLVSLQQAAGWIFERKVTVTPLVTHPLPIEAFDEGVLLYRQGEAIKVFYEMVSPYVATDPYSSIV